MAPTILLVLGSALIQGLVLVSVAPPPWGNLHATIAFLCMLPLNLSIWFIYTLVIYPRYLSPLRNLPCPEGANPILGHATSEFRFPRGEDYMKFMQEIPNDGLIRLKGILNRDHVLVTSTKGLAELLVARTYEFPKPENGREFLRRSIGYGLVAAEGMHHKRQRKHSLPSFAFRQIKMLYPLFWEKAVKMTKMIEAEALANTPSDKATEGVSGVTDIEDWVPKATLDIIGVAGLGRDFNTLEHSNDRISNLYAELTSNSPDIRAWSTVHVGLGGLAADILCPLAARRVARITKELRDLSQHFVQEKRKRQKAELVGEHIDTLACLIDAGVFSDEELVDQILTIIAAGHETTSSSFSWTIYLLCMHPEIQTRLREELHAALPAGPDTDASQVNLGSILESLPLLNGVCNETLRVFPTVPLSARTTKKDTTLLGHPIPAGTTISLAPWATNKDTAVWGSDAHEFKPERWVDPTTGKPNQTGGAPTNYAFLTFLHGPRSCIGQNFARAELRALVAAFVTTFEFTLADPNKKVVPVGLVTTKPRDGLKVKFTRVKPQ